MQTDTGTNQKSLSAATEHFGIECTLKAHDALNDAYYTAMIARKLDIEKGIAEYPGAKCSLCGSDKGRAVFTGIKSRRLAVSNREICNPSCPICGEKFTEIAPLVRANRFKYISIARCEKDGEFFVKLRLSDSKDTPRNVTVYRTVRGCSDKDVELYDSLVARELARKLGREEAVTDEKGSASES